MLLCQQQEMVTVVNNNPTLVDILGPTKGSDSYPKIKNRVNDWLRNERAKDHTVAEEEVTSEYIRKIFMGEVKRPSQIYLEALASVQNVDPATLFRAVGYRVSAGYESETDLLKRTELFLNGSKQLSDFTKDLIRDIIREDIERSEKEDGK